MRTLRRAAERQINAILSPAERRRVESNRFLCRNDDLRLTTLAVACQLKLTTHPKMERRTDKIDEFIRLRGYTLGVSDTEMAEMEQRGAERGGPPDDPILTLVRLALDGEPANN